MKTVEITLESFLCIYITILIDQYIPKVTGCVPEYKSTKFFLLQFSNHGLV